MTTKHTPGPWMIGDYGSFDGTIPVGNSKRRLLKVDGVHEESQANARLIAAAPELLEAMKEADPAFDFDIDAVRTLAKAALNQPSLQGAQKEAIAGLLQQYARFVRVARAAIAKAEGRET